MSMRSTTTGAFIAAALAMASCMAFGEAAEHADQDTMMVIDEGTTPEDIVNVIRLPGVADAAPSAGPGRPAGGGVPRPDTASGPPAVEGAEQARDGVADTATMAHDRGGEARDRAGDVAERAREGAGSRAEDARAQAADTAETMREAAESMREDLRPGSRGRPERDPPDRP